MGKIHSIETMGALDGPGIRMIVYFQGCALRCIYCHNPDTWNMSSGVDMSSEQIIKKAVRYKPYFLPHSGGVTFSGGEPLMQPEFLLECLKGCKEQNIHTAVDTSGVGKGNYDEMLDYTDLVILDIKHEDSLMYQKITRSRIDAYYQFKKAVIKKHQKVWLKHVVVPGITDQPSHLEALKKEIYQFNNIEKVELLPYHTMGVHKYKNLNIPYALENIQDMNMGKIKKMQEEILRCDLFSQDLKKATKEGV